MTSATGEQVIPFYIVCDESASMEISGGIAAINEALPDLYLAIAADPLVSDKSRLGILAFSDDAQVTLPLTYVPGLDALPGVEGRRTTNYGSAFRLLRSTINRDVARLKKERLRVNRPVVFFISDGAPSDDDWDVACRELQSDRYAPNILCYGVGDANAEVLAKVATIGCFIAEKAVQPGAVLREILRSVTNSIVSSTTRPSPELIVPDSVAGTVTVPLEEL